MKIDVLMKDNCLTPFHWLPWSITISRHWYNYIRQREREKHSPQSCLTHLYFSIILLASSRLSSVEVVPPGPPPPLESSSLFIAMNAKYMSPIIDCQQKKNVFFHLHVSIEQTVSFLGYYFSSFYFKVYIPNIFWTCYFLIPCQWSESMFLSLQ